MSSWSCFGKSATSSVTFSTLSAILHTNHTPWMCTQHLFQCPTHPSDLYVGDLCFQPDIVACFVSTLPFFQYLPILPQPSSEPSPNYNFNCPLMTHFNRDVRRPPLDAGYEPVIISYLNRTSLWLPQIQTDSSLHALCKQLPTSESLAPYPQHNTERSPCAGSELTAKRKIQRKHSLKLCTYIM